MRPSPARWHGLCWLPAPAFAAAPFFDRKKEPTMTEVSKVMTRHVRLARPDETLREAARAMAEHDIGSLPVGEGDRLVGMITDRDMVVRAVAQGLEPDTRVRDVMTTQVRYCFEDEDVAEVAQSMADLGIRRLAVLDREKRLVGIVALSNIVHYAQIGPTEVLLESVARPH
jgi:CBS domain-containing protein